MNMCSYLLNQRFRLHMNIDPGGLLLPVPQHGLDPLPRDPLLLEAGCESMPETVRLDIPRLFIDSEGF